MAKKFNNNFDVKILPDFSPPDVRISFYMSSMLTPEQEKEVESLISAWYIVGSEKGFEIDTWKGRFHYLGDVIFDDEQCLYIAADLGSCNEDAALQALFNIIESRLESYGVDIERVELE